MFGFKKKKSTPPPMAPPQGQVPFHAAPPFPNPVPPPFHSSSVPPFPNSVPNPFAQAPLPMQGGPIPNSPFAMPPIQPPQMEVPEVQEPMQDVPIPSLHYYKKPTNPIVKVLTAFVLLFALGFLIYYIYSISMPKGEQYATVQKTVYGQTYDGKVLILRDEVVYDDEGITDIDYIAKEGSQLGRTDIVSYVYTSGYSAKEKRALQNYRDQIKRYQMELLNTESTYDQKMSRLVEDVNARALEVKNIVQGESGNMLNLENDLKAAIDARQAYFKDKYSEDQRLNRLYDDETTQLKRIESWKKQNNTNVDGTVSFYTDGYEYGLNINDIDNYSPSYVQRLISGQRPDESAGRRGRTDIYRMVKSNTWYALMLLKNTTWNPVQGSTLKLTLQQFSDVTADATITSFTRNGNNLLLRLRILSDIKPILYTRTSNAQIGQYADALSVPKKALHKQDGAEGVVVLADTKKIFVPCEVLQIKDGTAYIKPQHNNTLFEGQTVILF